LIAHDSNEEVGTPSRRHTRPANRRDQILAAAEAHFAQMGFGATRLQSIADAVGIRVASLYNHFVSKDDLYAAVLQRALQPVQDLLDGALPDDEPEHPTAGLMVAFADLYATHPAIVRLFQHEMLVGDEGMHPLMREWLEQLSRAGRSHIQRLYIDTGRWSEDDVPLLQLTMFNAVCGYFTAAPLHRLLTGDDVSSREAIARQRAFLGKLETSLMGDQRSNDGEG
jgi:AcrR family transcriptional regulator